MSLNQVFLDYVMNDLGSGKVACKKMFGGAALYYKEKGIKN